MRKNTVAPFSGHGLKQSVDFWVYRRHQTRKLNPQSTTLSVSYLRLPYEIQLRNKIQRFQLFQRFYY